MNPWVILAVLVALAGAGGFGYGAGEKHAINACKAEKLEAERVAHADYVAGVKRAIDQADQLSSQNAEAESISVQRRARIETVFQNIDHEVIRYVQTDAGHGLCFDDDGLRLYNAANRGEFPAPDQPAPGPRGHGAVPGIAPGGGWFTRGNTANRQGGGTSVLHLPRTEAIAGGMGKAQP